MAKVPFSKLDAKINNEVKTAIYYNSKNESINYEIKYYLPVKEKLEVIEKIVNNSVDENGFYNPMRVRIYTVLELVEAYTNLSFTAKQKEDPFKLYDLLVSTGLYSEVVNNINPEDHFEIVTAVKETIENVYKYKNSVMGILDTVKNDYDNLNLDAAAIQSHLTDPNSLGLVKDILTKLG